MGSLYGFALPSEVFDEEDEEDQTRYDLRSPEWNQEHQGVDPGGRDDRQFPAIDAID